MTYIDPERKTSYCSYVEHAIEDVEYVHNGSYRRVGCSISKCSECFARKYKLGYARKKNGGKKSGKV